MDDTIHDGVCDYSAAKAGMPFCRFILRAEDCRPLIISALKDFKKVLVLLLSRDVKKPLIDNKELPV